MRQHAKLERLTPGQARILDQVRDDWLDLVFGCRVQVDAESVRRSVHWLYGLASLQPPIVVVLDSPMACQMAANMLAGPVERQVESQVMNQVVSQVVSQVARQVMNQVARQVRSQVRSPVARQVESQVMNQVVRQVESQVESQVMNQVESQVMNQVESQVMNQVERQVESQVVRQVESVMHYFATCSHDLLWDAGWTAFYDAFRRLGVVQHEKFDRWVEYLQHGITYGIFLQGLAVVCGLPQHIRRDAEHRLHCESGPAILWRDGYAQYFWHGVAAPQKLIEHPEQIDRQDLTVEQNAEVRRVYRERLGNERFAALLDLVEVDRDTIGAPGYERNYILHRTREADPVAEEHIQFVQVRCHSTGREYLLCVPPDIQDVYSGLAWTFGKRRADYAPVTEA